MTDVPHGYLFLRLIDLVDAHPWLSSAQLSKELGTTLGSLRVTCSKNMTTLSKVKSDAVKKACLENRQLRKDVYWKKFCDAGFREDLEKTLTAETV